jgi:hypothetical protein
MDIGDERDGVRHSLEDVRASVCVTYTSIHEEA